jgi:hypothetical protein
VFSEPVFRLFDVVSAFPEKALKKLDRRVRRAESERPALDGLFGLQRGLPHSLECRFIFRFEFTHLVDVRVVVGESFVHVGEGNVKLIRGVSGGLTAFDHPLGHVANSDTSTIDSWLATEHIFVTGETHIDQ